MCKEVGGRRRASWEQGRPSGLGRRPLTSPAVGVEGTITAGTSIILTVNDMSVLPQRTPSVAMPRLKQLLFIPTAHSCRGAAHRQQCEQEQREQCELLQREKICTLPVARSVRCSALRSLGTPFSQSETLNPVGLYELPVSSTSNNKFESTSSFVTLSAKSTHELTVHEELKVGPTVTTVMWSVAIDEPSTTGVAISRASILGGTPMAAAHGSSRFARSSGAQRFPLFLRLA